MVDPVIVGKTRNRRKFCSFYTESDPITLYMVNQLHLHKRDRVLEPCAGGGAFVDEILRGSSDSFAELEAVDNNPKAIEELQRKYKEAKNIKVRETDTLFDRSFDDISAGQSQGFSKIIGNPPYGVWQSHERRAELKRKYGGYVKDSYTLFLNRCLSLLNANGRLSFIVPDTFLALNLHKGTRKNLLTQSTIEEILLFPSSYFPGVSFGYANLCVISLIKAKAKPQHKIALVRVNSGVEKIRQLATGDYSVADSIERISQNSISEDPLCKIMIGGRKSTRDWLQSRRLKVTVGDLCDCVTGFYSGDNKKFLKPLSKDQKNTLGFEEVSKKEVFEGKLNWENHIDGLDSEEEIYIPFLKGGGHHFVKPTEWFLRWDRKTVDFYKTDKKARFQNSKYYFHDGIGTSMVKAKRLKAFDLENRIFDQSIVGVFSFKKEHKTYLLAYLNSKVCSEFIQAINHTANNSANYIKKIPIIINDKSIREVDEIFARHNLGDLDGLKNILRETDLYFESLFENEALRSNKSFMTTST